MTDSGAGRAGAVVLQILFRTRKPYEIEWRAEAASDPSGSEYGRHLSRHERQQLVLLPESERALVVDWLRGYGMELSAASVGPTLYARATLEQLEAAFGTELVDRTVGDEVDGRVFRDVLAMPRRLAGYVHELGVQTDVAGLFGPMAHGGRPSEAVLHREDAGHAPPTGGGSPRPGLTGLTPADIRQIYDFPDEWDGTGETIGLMMLGGALSDVDLDQFWRGHGIEPPEVRAVRIGPTKASAPHPLFDLEAAMTVQWAGAMAPGARLVVYFVDPAMIDDPWTAFLSAALWDEDNQPGVLCTSWVTPERKYYQRHGHRRVVGLLNEAAALGLTVISASGDWGAFDGVPRTIAGGEFVGDAPWPHAVFPAVEGRVLSVGGTMITSREPFTEMGWSGPPPPGLLKVLHFDRIASSGGFSQEVPIPGWQQPALRAYYPRGTSSPSVVPYGRGFPDVALAAAGPSVQRDGDASLSSQGYQAVTGGRWVDFAGGTSVAAPIWAAIIARANQARRSAGGSPVGFVNPFLYRLARSDPSPFRSVNIGNADVAMKVVDYDGRPTTFELDGYDSVPGWDPVTGLGVPRVRTLIRLLTQPRLTAGE